MKYEKLSQALDGIDDKYLLEAADIPAVANKKYTFVKWGAAAAACAVALSGGTFALYSALSGGTGVQYEEDSPALGVVDSSTALGEESKGVEECDSDRHSQVVDSSTALGEESKIEIVEVSSAEDVGEFDSVLVDEEGYDTAQQLIDASDSVIKAKVTGISFALYDPESGLPTDNVYNTGYTESTAFQSKNDLYTLYDLDVTADFKGDNAEHLIFKVYGGYNSEKYLDGQRKLYDNDTGPIPVYVDFPKLQTGEEYLFFLKLSDKETTPAIYDIVNVCQSVYDGDISEINSIDDVKELF